jgi:PAS domain S-box-containing protein
MSGRYSDPSLFLWTEDQFRALVRETSAEAGKAGVVAFNFTRYLEISGSKGPTIAEHVLAQLAEALRSTLRPEDKLGRVGKDSFAVLMIEDLSGTVAGAQRIFSHLAGVMRFPFSVGLAHSSEAASPDDLCGSAVAAAIESRRAGARQIFAGSSAGFRPVDAAAAVVKPLPSSALDARYQRLALLHRISLELFTEKPFADSMIAACRIIMALTGCRYVSLHFFDDFGNSVPAARYGQDVFSPGASKGGVSPEDAIVARTLAEGRVLSSSGGSAHWRSVALLPAGTDRHAEDGVLILGYLDEQHPDEDSDRILLEIGRLLRNARFLQKNQERQKIIVAVTEQSADAIFVTDLESRIISWNPSAQKLFQYRKEEMIGKSYHLLTSRSQEEEALRAGGVRFETTAKLKDGALVPLEVSFTPLKNEAGAAFGMVCVCRDITRRKEVERMKTEFVSLVSHELRTPLTAIQGFAETIFDFGDELEPAKLRQYLGIILEESKRLGRLVTNFLDISKLESGAVELNLREFDLQDLCVRLASLFREHPSQTAFETVIEPGSGTVLADEEQLYRVMLNLCGNALKYSPPKGKITITCRRVDGFTEIGVKDQGPGISAEHQAKLFEKFYRISDAVSQKTPGTGLGLAICKGIVAHHGGKIWVESVPGHGTTFKFTLRSPGDGANPGR